MTMRHSDQTQVFTVFGGAFVAEAHDHEQPRRTATAAGPMAAVLVALLLGSATTAGAIAATKLVHSTGYGFSYQTIPATGYEVATY
jgi:hypothetical protein